MLSFARQTAEQRLARLASQSLRYSSSQAIHNLSENGAASPTSSPTKRHDPGLEKRREARLAREAQRATRADAAPRGIANKRSHSSDPMMSATTAFLSGSPGQIRPSQNQHRKPSRRDQVQSSRAPGGTERSRLAASEPGPAEAIMTLVRGGAANRNAAGRTNSLREEAEASNGEVDPPQFTGPEPISFNLRATLDTVPNLTSALPPLPPQNKLRKAPENWIKSVYGGDYLQYKLDTSQYLKGARGLRSTYAKIIIGRNPTISLESQRQLIAIVQKMAQEASHTI